MTEIIKTGPSIIEISDNENHCDYILIKVTDTNYEVQKHQYDNDWNESTLKKGQLTTYYLRDGKDKDAIKMFMELITRLLYKNRERKEVAK